MSRRRFLAFLVMALPVLVAACGRRGRLNKPEDSKFPRKYPNH